MNIDSIQNGIVLDHITAGKGMEIYHDLGLEKLDCSVAIITNVKSHKMGKKDIIKIDKEYSINLDLIGYIDPNVSVNIIKDGVTIEKKKLASPQKVINVVKCKNPRCITTIEQEIDQIFELVNTETRVYRCIYCETEVNG
ncbi:MAG: aspartate carbamoyltransferase regulatory subunit [Lachnospiraceae bacterium]|nr:aspartate carbamoyltransferase regulatory subunit [Lachnospiraceae bacterium]